MYFHLGSCSLAIITTGLRGEARPNTSNITALGTFVLITPGRLLTYFIILYLATIFLLIRILYEKNKKEAFR